jgi:hypothetical protein
MTARVDMSSATNRSFGQSIKRREDPKYLTGLSQYTDDLTSVQQERYEQYCYLSTT